MEWRNVAPFAHTWKTPWFCVVCYTTIVSEPLSLSVALTSTSESISPICKMPAINHAMGKRWRGSDESSQLIACRNYSCICPLQENTKHINNTIFSKAMQTVTIKADLSLLKQPPDVSHREYNPALWPSSSLVSATLRFCLTAVEKKNFLHSCKIKSGSGLGTRLAFQQLAVTFSATECKWWIPGCFSSIWPWYKFAGKIFIVFSPPISCTAGIYPTELHSCGGWGCGECDGGGGRKRGERDSCEGGAVNSWHHRQCNR